MTAKCYHCFDDKQYCHAFHSMNIDGVLFAICTDKKADGAVCAHELFKRDPIMPTPSPDFGKYPANPYYHLEWSGSGSGGCVGCYGRFGATQLRWQLNDCPRPHECAGEAKLIRCMFLLQASYVMVVGSGGLYAYAR